MGLETRSAELENCATKYVAISHVWADGLGSSSEIGLPECQIRSLSLDVLGSYNTAQFSDEAIIPFWIDSLCVPSQRNLRRTAIGIMAKTYANASVVLVLDEGIRQIYSTDSILEKMFVIFVSAWVQRLWPLQEMLLGE